MSKALCCELGIQKKKSKKAKHKNQDWIQIMENLKRSTEKFAFLSDSQDGATAWVGEKHSITLAAVL